jgi:rare lipoprotein A
LKNQKNLHSNFINWNKKALLLFISIAFSVISTGQNIKKDKIKTSKYKDSVNKSKSLNSKTEKIVSNADTIKKVKPIFDQLELEVDSLFIGTGNFKLFKKNAHASYYANKFHNHKTASGARYNKNKLTAAHKKLPFGTIVKVTNEANGKFVLVEVNDRGPFVRSRDIDLSRRAFMELTANKSSGNMKVTLETLQK